APELTVHLDAARGKRPARENGCELIAGRGLAGRVVAALDLLFEHRLERLQERPVQESPSGPLEVKKASRADLQAGSATRHEDGDGASHETFRHRVRRGGVR